MQLPPEIQNKTTYAIGLSASPKGKAATEALIKLLHGSAAAAVLTGKGMEPAG